MAARRWVSAQRLHGSGQYSDCDRLRATAHRGLCDPGPVTWREGLLWGLGGFVVFTAAPGLGLPPELPGLPVAELAARQTWWIATAAATAIGLCLMAFRSAAWAAVLGLGLIALPHLIGAPLAPESHGEVPPALSHRFIVVVPLTSLLFWALLGVSTSITFGRISRR